MVLKNTATFSSAGKSLGFKKGHSTKGQVTKGVVRSGDSGWLDSRSPEARAGLGWLGLDTFASVFNRVFQQTPFKTGV